MLTELKLSNFMMFKKEVELRIRPITILIGKNNAGKSLVINFLNLIRIYPIDVTADFKYSLRAGKNEGCSRSVSRLRFLSAERKLEEGFDKRGELDRGVSQTGENAISVLRREKILSDPVKKKLLLKHTEQMFGIDSLSLKEFRDYFPLLTVKKASENEGRDWSYWGSGFHKCLPIFVQGLSMPRNSHLIVEHPELGIHPTAQIEMGDFFIDLWKERGVGSIIETHSDSIILRMQHRIRKGLLSEQDVSIAYFTDDGEKPVIKNIDVGGDGVLRGLPMKFFGGNLMESLRMGASDDDETDI